MPNSYIDITNKQQIDSITQTFVDREIYPFIYTRLEDSNGVVAYENLEKNERLFKDKNIDVEKFDIILLGETSYRNGVKWFKSKLKE